MGDVEPSYARRPPVLDNVSRAKINGMCVATVRRALQIPAKRDKTMERYIGLITDFVGSERIDAMNGIVDKSGGKV